MDKKQNLAFGVSFLVLGLGAAIVLDPWFLGVPFIIIGALRLLTVAQLADPEE